MTTNGITTNQPGLGNKVLAMEILKLPEKRPSTWAAALVLCREGAGWTRPDLINRAVKDATKTDIAKWERGDHYPPPRFTELLRKFLPHIESFDDLLPPHLRGDPKKKREKAAAPAVEAPPAPAVDGWKGPMPLNFGNALRFCREKAGMKPADVGRIIGVAQPTVVAWELEKTYSAGDPFRMIHETYQRLCELFPMLAFGPKPAMSKKFVNQRKGEAYFDAMEARGELAKKEHIVKQAIAAHIEESKPKPIDEAPATMAGAQFGVIAAQLAGLKSKLKKLESEYLVAKGRIEAEIATVEERKVAAELEMERVAHEVHGAGA